MKHHMNSKLKAVALKALLFYADGWHYRKGHNDSLILETGEVALKALHILGGKCSRPTCRKCSKK